MYQPLLNIDLTRGRVERLDVPAAVRHRWIGGTGLGLYLLSQEIWPRIRASDPECPAFILTGPLTGTQIPQSSDWVIVTVNADLPTHICASHCHGYLGARLRQAGWDGIVLRGRAVSPTYLWIGDGTVELRPASSLWGLDTCETDVQLRRELETADHPVSVACIGPAGEQLVYGASVRAESSYGASQGGAGVAWGAKRLKAIAVAASGQVPVADHSGLAVVAEQWLSALRAHPKPPSAMQADGLHIMPGLAERGFVPGKHFTDPEFGLRWGRRLAEDLPRWRIEAVGSWNCEMACHHRTECTTGPLAGAVVSGYGGEVMEELGPNMGIEDPGVALVLAGEVDRLGMGAGWVPRVVAMLMEAYNAGEIGLAETGGLDLRWGNWEAVLELLQLTVKREGLGALVAKGLRETARALGIEHRAVHMKGTGFNDHEQRAGPMMLFQSQVASGAGPSWQSVISLAAGTSGAEPDLGLKGLDPHDLEAVADATFRSQCKKLWEDCLGVCYFATRGIPGILAMEVEALRCATGQEWTPQDALLHGERITSLQRLVLLHLGYTPQDDFDIAPRLLEKLRSGPAEGIGLTLEELTAIRSQYYACLGWSADTGAPGRAVLGRLGLDDVRIGRADERTPS
jgi:aldehyde:ferredoxin oxidoreductase